MCHGYNRVAVKQIKTIFLKDSNYRKKNIIGFTKPYLVSIFILHNK